jgi:hypothetical protein
MTAEENQRVIDLANEWGVTPLQAFNDLEINNCIEYNPEIDKKSMVPSALGYFAGYFDATNATASVMKLRNAGKYEIYISYSEGKLMKLYKDTITGEQTFDVECLALGLGYASVHDYLSDDKTLDALNECVKLTGKWPIKVD